MKNISEFYTTHDKIQERQSGEGAFRGTRDCTCIPTEANRSSGSVVTTPPTATGPEYLYCNDSGYDTSLEVNKFLPKQISFPVN